MGLDQLDRAILQLLHTNGRMAYSAIARELDSNEATVRKRVERLIRDDVVQIIGVSNPHPLGFDTHIMIGMDVDLSRLQEVAEQISSLDEFSYVACATGQYDIVAIGVFSSDEELFQFLSQKLSKIDGIRQTYTTHLIRLMRRTFNYRIPRESLDPAIDESAPGFQV